MYLNISVLAGIVFLYSISSGWFEKTSFNGALIFTIVGLLVGPLGLNILHLDVDAELLKVLAELTLALVLFTDASNANLKVLKQHLTIPQRLLLIGLPVTIVVGFVTGYLLFDNLTLIEIAILATMLAPTDAALGKAVVTDGAVPESIREGLNVESGLNDGICVPILFVFLALAVKTASDGSESTWVMVTRLVVENIGIGIAVGGGFTLLACWLLKKFARNMYITESWCQLPIVALSVLCFSIAQCLGGSGFIASFVGGLLFGWIAKKHKHKLLLAAEGIGDTLALITWVLFGAVVVGHTITHFNWSIIVYALLSLTIIRIVPVLLSLIGTNLRTDERLFVGWFGPRGLASVVFGVIVLGYELPGGNTIVLTAVCTIILSIVLHGVTAKTFIRKLRQRIDISAE